MRNLTREPSVLSHVRARRNDAPTVDVAGLYVSTGPRLVGLLVSVGASRPLAEDLLQEAYARLLPRWNSVRQYDDPEAWVRKVALRLYLSHRRREELFQRRAPLFVDALNVEGPSPDRIALEAAVATLPTHQRIIVVLYYVCDLPVDEIAQVLQVSPGTVKSRLSRARAHLIEAFVRTEPTDEP